MEKHPLPGTPAKPDEARLVLLGIITKPQGIKGGLRLMAQFDNPDDFENLKTDRIFLKPDPSTAGLRPRPSAYSQVTLTEFDIHHRFLVVYFEEAPDINRAEAFRNLQAYVYEEELWDLPEGRYYGFQLEGLELFDTNKNAVVGKVKAMRAGVQDYLIITGLEREFLIPYVPEIVTGVDLNQGRITAQLPEGIEEV